MRLLLGNPAVKEAYRDTDGEIRYRAVDGARVTSIVIPDSYTLLEKVAAVIAADGMWNQHTQGDNVGDVTPDWVEADDEAVALIVAQQLGCPVGRPKSWKGLS